MNKHMHKQHKTTQRQQNLDLWLKFNHMLVHININITLNSFGTSENTCVLCAGGIISNINTRTRIEWKPPWRWF